MVGLHTCGDLAPNTLRIFASKSEVRGVCSVGCCYHLLSEEFENQDKGSKYSLCHNSYLFQLLWLLFISFFGHYCVLIDVSCFVLGKQFH